MAALLGLSQAVVKKPHDKDRTLKEKELGMKEKGQTKEVVPFEPPWKGPRAVCVSQGSTGTHSAFQAAAVLGLPAVHWYDQHRSGGTPSQLASGKTAHTPVDEVVRHTTTDTGRQLKAGNSMFKSHDAMLELYDAVKRCTAGEADCPNPASWYANVKRTMSHVKDEGFSFADVPYSSVPQMLPEMRKDGTVFIRLQREAEDWAGFRLKDHSIDSDPVCHRDFWSRLMAHGSSPFDLGSCAKQCASAHRSGYECFQTLTNFTQAELVKAFNANEKMLEGLFPDALSLDVFKQEQMLNIQHHHAVKYSWQGKALALQIQELLGCLDMTGTINDIKMSSFCASSADWVDPKCVMPGCQRIALPEEVTMYNKQFTPVKVQANPTGKNCVLLAVTSYKGHAGEWEWLTKWAEERTVGACGGVVVVTGAIAGMSSNTVRHAAKNMLTNHSSSLDEDAEMFHGPMCLSIKHVKEAMAAAEAKVEAAHLNELFEKNAQVQTGNCDVLFLGGNDDWAHLPEKELRMHHAFVTMPQLAKYSHIMKVDDTDVLAMQPGAPPPPPGPRHFWVNFSNWTLAGLERRLAFWEKNFGTLDYSGMKVTNMTQTGTWHIGNWKDVPMKCPGEYWCGRAYLAPRRDVYCNGGSGYMLSKRAASHVTKSMGISEADVDKLFKTELYEDVVIGHWLEDGGFIPRHFPLLDKDAEWANYTTHNPIFASGKHHGAALRVNPHAYDPDDENPIMLHLKKDESIFARLREVAGPRR
jgi:hypothetical protein